MTTPSAALPHSNHIASVPERIGAVLLRLGRRPNEPVGSAPVQPAAQPYEGGFGPLGVLVLHGFTGSPPAVRPWADRLQSDGFRVAVPRLPGHGTTWQEMNQTRWQDWYGQVESSFEELRAQCEQTFVCGLSMGGGLGLLLAARYGDKIGGLSLVNPSVGSADPRMRALPVLRHLLPSLGAIGGDIAKPGITEGAYDRTPLHAAWSLTKLWQQIREELPRVDQPIQIYKSRIDHVVDPSSVALIQKQVRSSDLEIIDLERSYHVATLDYDADLIFSGTSQFFARLATAAK